MGFTILERLLHVERERPRAARGGGFSTPIMHEHALPGASGPYLVTGATGRFLPTRRTSEGLVRCGMFPCKVADEGAVLKGLVEALLVRAPSVRCATLQAVPGIFQPKHVVIPTEAVVASGTSVDKAHSLVSIQGSLGELFGAEVLPADDFPHIMFVAEGAGVYVRSGDHMGLMLTDYPHKFLVVPSELA